MLHRLYPIRYWLLLLVLALCAGLWPGVRTAIETDNSLSVWFLKDDPMLKDYRRFHERFGNDEVVVLMVRDDKGLLSPDYFSRFTAMGKALQAHPGVQVVIGPGTVNTLHYDNFGLFTAPLFDTAYSAADVRRSLGEAPYLKEQLFNSDYTAARFLIVFKPLPDFDRHRARLLSDLKATVHQHLPPSRTHFGGVGIIYDGLNSLSSRDFGLFLALAYGAMFLLLLWIYRTPALLLYAMGTIALSTYITLGIYGAMGLRLNLMTLMIPTILVLLGVIDMMHILNERARLHARGLPPKESALLALKNPFRACLFSTLTEMVGFLSLCTSPMLILQQFGLFAALGIGLCLVFTYLLGLIILPLASPSPKVMEETQVGTLRFTDWITRHRRIAIGVSLALLLAGGTGIALLRTDNYTYGYFPKHHPVVRDHEAMEEAWGPYMPLELMVTPKPGYSLHSPEVIQRTIAFADSVRRQKDTGPVFGFHSLYQVAVQVRYGDRSDRMYRSRSVLSAVREQLPVYFPDLSSQFMHEPSGTGRITLSGHMLSAGELTRKTDEVLALARSTLGPVADVRPVGYQPMYAGIVSYVTRSQISSLLMSVLLVFALAWMFIRRFHLAFLATVTNFFPIILMLGFMGWAGITLDTASASIAAIALSICIDDTIHFIYYYNRFRSEGEAPAYAIRHTVRHTGSAIVLTSVVLFAGYTLMIFGSLKTVEYFGLLTAIAIALALYAQLVIFPLLLEWAEKRVAGQRAPAPKDKAVVQ